MPCNSDKKEIIFDIMTKPEHICEALIYVESTGSSPVAYYEKIIKSMIDDEIIFELNSNEKQFVGTSACVIMESNGWNKTGKKQRFTKGIFKSAEIYIK